jgi:uncharacterized YccA/Bax inhibitor family protein
MTSSNPTLGAFTKVGAMGLNREDSGVMTVDGTIHKTGILAVILMLTFGITWSAISHETIAFPIPLIGGLLGGLILSLIICFKPTTAPYLSPAYAAAEGVLLAAFSYILELKYPGIAIQAALLTFVVLFAMLFAYRTGLIVVNNTFRAVVVGAIMAIGVFYLVGIVCMIFGYTIPGIAINGSLLSIGIQLVIAVVAALTLALDFDMIAQNAGTAPKFMEWYGAFSLMVTLVWLYITLLRLLANLRSRD